MDQKLTHKCHFFGIDKWMPWSTLYLQKRSETRRSVIAISFVLGVDVLAQILKRASMMSFISQIGNSPTNPDFACLQYADDTALLAPTDRRSLMNIKILLICFEMLSGLSINFNKSAVF